VERGDAQPPALSSHRGPRRGRRADDRRRSAGRHAPYHRHRRRHVAGPKLNGTARGGADWQIIRADGFTEVDARYTLETESGDLIYVSNLGIRHAPPDVIRRLNAGELVDQSQIYFRSVPKFETGAPELQWLMRSIFVATGERYPNGVVIRFWRVL
jgi:hypothetical protein